jgi:2-alkenal reductase
MKNFRLLTLTLLLVVVLGLSACTVALPGTFGSVDNLLPARSAVAQVATPVPSAAAAAPSAGLSDLQTALEQVYQAANPSVVNIQVTSKATSQIQVPEMPGFPSLPDAPQMPNLQPSHTLGSGFVWDKQGHIVTNNHVVDGADKITVTFYDGLTLPAELVGRDPDSDLAVIKVDPTNVDLRPLPVADSTEVKVGQFVVAIGNPFGLEGTMTFGIVSALGRTLPTSDASAEGLASNAPTYTIPDIIQTDAPVNPGNSGGVLLDLQGRLIGVPSAIESPVRSSAGVGFAIPSAIVQRVIPALIETGRFEHPWIGISGGTLTPELAKAMNLPETQRGVLVHDVVTGSPADQAGLRGSTKQAAIESQKVLVGGDLITAIDGQPVKQFEDLTTYLARHTEVGQTIKLTVLRDGKETAISLKLVARPAQ